MNRLYNSQKIAQLVLFARAWKGEGRKEEGSPWVGWREGASRVKVRCNKNHAEEYLQAG